MLASLPQEERKVLLLQEWIQAYGDEASGGAAFQSPLLRVEAKLGRAIVFSEAVPPPSDIPTAVAFEALQVAEESSGALRPLLRLLRRVLMQAVYVEPASDPEGVSRPAALAERGGSAAMQRYLAHTLHAAEALRMREERERVRAVAERLRGTLVAWERARQEQLLKAEQRKQVAGTWQRLLSKTTQQQSANARAELSASIGAGETDGAMASGYGTVDGAVDAFLAIDGEEMRLQAIMAALETMPHALRTVVRRLMVGTEETRAAIGAAPAAQLALEALTERAEQLEPAVLTRFVDSLFSSASVGADPAVLSAMLSKAVEAAGTAGLEALPGILRMLMRSGGGRWRGPAVRFLSSVDSDLLLPGEVDAHVAGQQVEGVRVLRPGELGSSVGRMFNRDELTTLLRDLLDLLHGAAADSVIAAIVDPRGPLHQSFGGDIAAADRLALLRLLLETSSAEEVLAAMPDRLLRELKLGMFAVEAAPRPTSGSSGAGGGDAKETKSAARSPAQRKPRVPPQLASLRKYLGAPPKNLKSKAKIKSERAASLVYEIWAAKAREDTFDDSRGEERQGLGAYTRDYLLQKLGLASLADGALYGIVDAVRRFGTKNSRLVLFGRMMGVLDADTFSPRLSDTFLNLCKRCFPKFTDKTLKNRPVGTCFVPLEIATGAFNRVFPSADQRVRPSTERIALEMDLKAMLGREVHANAVEYSSVARTGPDDDGPAGAKTGRAIRGGPDFSGSTIVVDFDWLAGRVLDVWQTQRERDKRSMQRLFVMHDADKNGVLSFDEFIAMLADCTPNAKSKAESTAAAATVLTTVRSLLESRVDDLEELDLLAPELQLANLGRLAEGDKLIQLVTTWAGGLGRPTESPKAGQALNVFEEACVATEPVAQFAAWFAEAASIPGTVPDEGQAVTLATSTPGGFPSARVVVLKQVDRRGFVFFTNTLSRKGRELRRNPRAALVVHWPGLGPGGRSVRVEGPVEAVTAAESDAYFRSRSRGSRIGAWASEQSTVLEGGRAELESRFASAGAMFAGGGGAAAASGDGGTAAASSGDGGTAAAASGDGGTAAAASGDGGTAAACGADGASSEDTVPRPAHWGGVRVVPTAVEFWASGPDRMHDRLRYERQTEAGGLAGCGEAAAATDAASSEWKVVRLSP